MLRALPELAVNSSVLAKVEQQMKVQNEMIRTWNSQQSHIPEATVRMLQSLHGYRIGLVTSSGRAEVEPVLKAAGIDSCFHTFVFRDDCPRHKPDPAPCLLVLERLGVNQGIAFEDSDAGIKSASAARLTAVRVEDPYQLPDIVNRALA
jgi:HAD superfamily hydrolase (TIGR01509 family)